MIDDGQGAMNGDVVECLVRIMGVEAAGGVRNEDDIYSYLDTHIMHRSQSSGLIITMIRVVCTNGPVRKRPSK